MILIYPFVSKYSNRENGQMSHIGHMGSYKTHEPIIIKIRRQGMQIYMFYLIPKAFIISAATSLLPFSLR